MHTATATIDIKYLSHLIHQSYSVPIHFLSKNKDIIFEYTSHNICNPFYLHKEEQLRELYGKDDPNNFPIIKTNRYLENFIVIHITNHESVEGTLVIGPCIYPRVSKDKVMRFINEFDSNIKLEDGVAYFQSIPTIKKLTLIDIGILFHYLIFNEKVDINTFWERNKLLEETSYPSPNPDLYISSLRQDSSNQYDIALEQQLFTAIKEGNKEKVIEYTYAFPKEDAVTFSQTSQLRSRKNHGIATVTLATQYAIEGNLPSEIAFSLRSLYIQTLEQLDNTYAVNRLIEDALCTFADRVKEYNTHNYSRVIVTCLDYISKNIYNEITLNTIAKSVKLNPSYLSNLFKQEIGISLSEYIQKERIEEAKKLLTLTTCTIVEICTWLNFNDQSYFTKVFKKFTNMTPKQYREKHTVL
ncbi:helix-turn-helix domain-containing protein [Bacillus pseudomycoides]|uniref:Helix-turn-helix domain-containing protein n=1 Tax=Bacillus bingmayongensis TaxID=1150157 RepID=A0ABU5JQP6_9BACI|nr:helix-turn-helix domain-containing protein [Bacillus pseudomycoides]